MVETILEGCEIICIGEQNTDLVACPLSKEEQLKCKEKRQHLAGVKDVLEVIGYKPNTYTFYTAPQLWKTKLMEWGIE